MTEIDQDNLAKAFEMLEAGKNPEDIFGEFPEKKEEIKKMSLLLNDLGKEKENIPAPKEILEKILEKNAKLNRALGRSSVRKKFSQLINNLNFMDQKLKISVSLLGVVMIIAVGIFAYKFGQDKTEVANIKVPTSVEETKLATITPVIGNKEVDASINNALNNVLNEDSLDSELADIELALSDEAALDEINNLINDDEL